LFSKATKVSSLENGKIVAAKNDVKKRKKYVVMFFYN